MIVTSLAKEIMNDYINIIDNIIKEKSWMFDENGGVEVYVDYNGIDLSKSDLSAILESDSPGDCYQDILCDMAFDYELSYKHELIDEVYEQLKEKLRKQNNELLLKYLCKYEDAICSYIDENTYYYFDERVFNDLKVNLMIDVGNWNYDCSCDNVLNWCGNGTVDDKSSLLWLAKQQGIEQELRDAVEKCYNGDIESGDIEDPTVRSFVEEFENNTSDLSTLTFLLKMDMPDIVEILEKQKEEYNPEYRYNPLDNKESKSYIMIGKNTECGLFDTFRGGGSTLEIVLKKNVKVPIQCIKLTIDGVRRYGYDVDEVYGLVGSCWKESVKTDIQNGKRSVIHRNNN